MADIEKVITGLEHCIKDHVHCNGCPYDNHHTWNDDCITQIETEALEIIQKFCVNGHEELIQK